MNELVKQAIVSAAKRSVKREMRTMKYEVYAKITSIQTCDDDTEEMYSVDEINERLEQGLLKEGATSVDILESSLSEVEQ